MKWVDSPDSQITTYCNFTSRRRDERKNKKKERRTISVLLLCQRIKIFLKKLDLV